MTGVKKDDNGRGVGYFQDQVPRLKAVFKVKKTRVVLKISVLILRSQ